MLIFVFLAKIQRPNTLNGYGWMKGEDSREKEGGMVTLSLFGFFFFFSCGRVPHPSKAYSALVLWKIAIKKKRKKPFLQCTEIEEI